MRPFASVFAPAAFAVGMVCAGGAAAAGFDVPCDADALLLALEEVNGNGDEDALILAPSCYYVLPETMVVEADGGSRVTVHGRGATLSGSVQHTTVRVQQGASLHLIEVSVRDGVGLGTEAGGIATLGALKLTRSTVSANSAESAGGGISLYDQTGATLELVDSTLIGNSAVYGGGIYVGYDATATIVNSTLTGNIGTHGAGILAFAGPQGSLLLHNSIVANSFPGVDCSTIGFPTIVATGGNLIEKDGCAIPGVLTVDPMLGLPTGNPVYYPLLAGSPAIDAGSNDGCPAVDQRNVQRPLDGNGDGVALCDLGAFERPKSAACGLTGIEACFLLLPFARRLARLALGQEGAAGAQGAGFVASSEYMSGSRSRCPSGRRHIRFDW